MNTITNASNYRTVCYTETEKQIIIENSQQFTQMHTHTPLVIQTEKKRFSEQQSCERGTKE